MKNFFIPLLILFSFVANAQRINIKNLAPWPTVPSVLGANHKDTLSNKHDYHPQWIPLSSLAAGSVTSVGLSMPPAFIVSGSPVTGAGTLVVSGTGTSSQYIKGDGTLGTLPDQSATNEIQNITMSGNTITLSLGGGSVVIPTGDTTLAGDVTGTTHNNKVVRLNTIPLSAVVPTTGQVLVFDGTQWIPTTKIDNDTSATNEIQVLSIVGNNLTLSNGGGTITLPSPPAQDTTLFGDVNGGINSNYISKIQNVPIAASSPLAGQVMKYDGSQWAPGNVTTEQDTCLRNGEPLCNGITKGVLFEQGGFLAQNARITYDSTTGQLNILQKPGNRAFIVQGASTTNCSGDDVWGIKNSAGVITASFSQCGQLGLYGSNTPFSTNAGIVINSPTGAFNPQINLICNGSGSTYTIQNSSFVAYHNIIGTQGGYNFLANFNSCLRMFNTGTGINAAFGSTSPIANAALEVVSTTGSFYPPRMTNTQRNAMTGVQAGAVIYNTTTNKLNMYNGSAWEQVTSL